MPPLPTLAGISGVTAGVNGGTTGGTTAVEVVGGCSCGPSACSNSTKSGAQTNRVPRARRSRTAGHHLLLRLSLPLPRQSFAPLLLRRSHAREQTLHAGHTAEEATENQLGSLQ